MLSPRDFQKNCGDFFIWKSVSVSYRIYYRLKINVFILNYFVTIDTE